MKKIISLFQRNYDGDRLVRDEIVPGAEWVVNGEGIAYRKWDGTSVLRLENRWWKRYDAKHGKNPPEGFLPAQEPDEVTGHWPGWIPVDMSKPEDRWIAEACLGTLTQTIGKTFEACGPKINGNNEGGWLSNPAKHQLFPHCYMVMDDAPRTFGSLKLWLSTRDIEGIVWHHPDGRMVKAKKKDFGLKRKPQ